jgi:integrase
MARTKRRRARGTGSVYQKNRLWSVSWVENGERRYSHGYPTKDLAEKVRANIALDLAAGRGGLKRPKDAKPLRELAEAWLERREATHRSHKDDRRRWTRHLEPEIGHMVPDAVDTGTIRKLVEKKLAEGLSPATCLLLVRLLSTLYTDLIESHEASTNPARMLPKGTKKLIRPTYDPKKTPFVEKREDIARIFQTLPPPVNIAYALSALAGLRPGEVRALKWPNVDLDARKIYVRESVDGPTKDKDARVVPIVNGLAQVLTGWREERAGEVVVTPLKKHGRYLNNHTIDKELEHALTLLKLPPLTFYEAGRHTFASHWVLAGGSIEMLREILGHSTVKVTERYAHLRPDLFPSQEVARANIDLLATRTSR